MYLGLQNSIGSTVANEGSPLPPTPPYASNFISATGITDARQQTAISLLADDLINSGFSSKIIALYPFISNYRNYIWTPFTSSPSWWACGVGTPTSWNGTVTYPAISGMPTSNAFALTPYAGAKTSLLGNGGLYWNAEKFTRINQILATPSGIIIDTNGNIVNTPTGLDDYGVINAGNGWFRLWIKQGFSTYSVFAKITNCPYIVFYTTSLNLFVGASNNISFDTTTFSGTEQIQVCGLQSEVNTIQQTGLGFGAPTNYQYVPFGTDPTVNMSFCYRFNFMDTTTYPLAYNGTLNYWNYGLSNNNGIIDTGIVPSAITGMNNAAGAVRYSSAKTGGNYLNGSNIAINGFNAQFNDRIFGASKVTGSSYFEMCNYDTTGSMFFGVNSGYGNSTYATTPVDLYNAVKRSTGFPFIKGVKENTLFTNGNPFGATVDRSIYLGSSNQGSSVLLSKKIMSCVAFGIDLTDTEILTLRTIMENYNIFLNRQ